MVFEAERCEEVTFDIDITPEVGFRKAKTITSQDHRANNAGVAEHQGERRILLVWTCLAESQRRSIPQAQRETSIEAAK